MIEIDNLMIFIINRCIPFDKEWMKKMFGIILMIHVLERQKLASHDHHCLTWSHALNMCMYDVLSKYKYRFFVAQ